MNKWKVSLVLIMLTAFLTSCSLGTLSEVNQNIQEVTTAAPSQEVAQSVVEEEPGESGEPEEVAVDTLKRVYEAYGIKAGTCLSEQMIRNKRCEAIILDNFNSITFENQMKPDYIFNKKESKATGELVVEFDSTAKTLLQWCADNNMAVRGHTLIWHSQTPSWIFYEDFNTSGNLVSREVMLERMDSYIRQVFGELEDLGYLELFYAYDVVNEAWMEDGTKRDNLWLQTIGEDYLWYAFYYADMYAPEYIDLYYNDYNEQFKTETLYNFVQTLVDENGNYLIDGIGLQAHLYTEDNLEDYLATVERLGSTGLKVNLTELDVSLGTWTNIKPGTEENFKIQGQYYYNLVNGLLQLVQEDKVEMDSLTFWGFADKLSWRSDRKPLLFDAVYEPKYSYYGALQIKEMAGFEE